MDRREINAIIPLRLSERDASSKEHYHKVLSNTQVANTNHVLLSSCHQGELTL